MQMGMLAEIQLGVATEGMTAVTEPGVMTPGDGMMTAAIAGVTGLPGVSLTGISTTTGTDRMTTGVIGPDPMSPEVARELRS